MAAEETELEGTVVKKSFSPGSKSAHDAVCLETDSDTYVLRRSGANPFSDNVLLKLVGRRIKARGVITDYLFLVSSYEEV